MSFGPAARTNYRRNGVIFMCMDTSGVAGTKLNKEDFRSFNYNGVPVAG